MAKANRFHQVIANERIRLQAALTAAMRRRDEISKEVESLTAELKAVEAYHSAMGGAATRSRAAKKSARPSDKKGAGKPVRRSGIREQVLDRIKAAADGISRGELLNVMGMKGNKSGEMAVTNALAALKKMGRAIAKEGKYLGAE